MKEVKKKRLRDTARSVTFPAIIAVVVFVLLFWGINTYSGIQREQNRILTENAIKKAAVQCYANEGKYPARVDYLVEHYGVNIDTDSFNIIYDCIASNVCPMIEVYNKR